MDPSEYNKRGTNASSGGACDRPEEAGRGEPRPYAASPYRLEKRLELLRARGVPELPKRLALDLADPLSGHVEGAADLLEGVLGAVPHAEAHLEDLLLAGRQGLQDPAGLVLQVRHQDRVDRRKHLAILDEVAQMRILFLPDGRLERDRLLRDLHDLAHL